MYSRTTGGKGAWGSPAAPPVVVSAEHQGCSGTVCLCTFSSVRHPDDPTDDAPIQQHALVKFLQKMITALNLNRSPSTTRGRSWPPKGARCEMRSREAAQRVGARVPGRLPSTTRARSSPRSARRLMRSREPARGVPCLRARPSHLIPRRSRLRDARLS